jgi:hypothetical protein
MDKSMNILYFSIYNLSSLKKNFVSSLNSQKKILFIAFIALGMLANCDKVCAGSFRTRLPYQSEGEKRVVTSFVTLKQEKGLTTFSQPILISDDWGEIILEVNGEEKKFKDVVILPSDIAGQQIALEWNWRWQTNEQGQSVGMSHQPGIRIIDIEHYILSREDIEKPDVIILSQGRGHGGQRENLGPGILQVETDVESYLIEKGFEVYILKTAAALEKYQQLVREGKKRVAALIHTSC